MRAEEYTEKRLELEGWPVRLVSYRLGDTWHCTADNVSPGARLARGEGATRDEAENKAIEQAQRLLVRTKRHAV